MTKSEALEKIKKAFPEKEEGWAEQQLEHCLNNIDGEPEDYTEFVELLFGV